MEAVDASLSKDEKRWIKLMNYGKRLGCHQRSDRSFFYKNYQFPVCARCTGVIVGYIICPILFAIFKFNITMTCISVIFCSIMFLDWFIQFMKIKKSNNMRRLITGILGGVGVSYIFFYIIFKLYDIIIMKI